MAIYHLRATMISRSAGRCATAAAAYRSAAQIADLRTGLTYDYRAKGGVEHVEIIAPATAPDWIHDRAALWNAVEAAETRKNSQVAREIRVALPAELAHAERVELVREFARAQFVERGMVADIAIHAPGRDGDERNHHAHILLTTREIDAQGFTTKNRDWNAVELLEGWREAWARDSNQAMERAGIEERIDHRTLEAQRDEALELAAEARERGDGAEELRETVRALSLDRPPLPQLSSGAWQLKERGIEVAAVRTWHEVKAQAAEVARIVQDLAVHIRDRLGHAADRVLERLGGNPGDLALAGESDTPSERETSDGLAARLRAAFSGVSGVDRDALSERLSAYRQERSADELSDAQEQQRQKALEQEQERHATRDRGHDYGL